MAKLLSEESDVCAEFYENKPGLVSHMTTIDLYRAIARLARIVEKQQIEIDRLTKK